MGFADAMLTAGCAPHIEVVHSETIKALDGPDTNNSFVCVIETKPDSVLDESIYASKDRRQRLWLRFMIQSPIAQLQPAMRIQRNDGTVWQVVDRPQDGFLSNDFEIQQVVAGLDK